MKAIRADEDDPRRGATGVPPRLKEITEKITAVPAGFNVHKTIQRFLDNRRKAVETGRASTGRRPRRWPSARCCSTATRCASRARIASAAPSRSAIRC
jgi:hypothetical protein